MQLFLKIVTHIYRSLSSVKLHEYENYMTLWISINKRNKNHIVAIFNMYKIQLHSTTLYFNCTLFFFATKRKKFERSVAQDMFCKKTAKSEERNTVYVFVRFSSGHIGVYQFIRKCMWSQRWEFMDRNSKYRSLSIHKKDRINDTQ